MVTEFKTYICKPVVTSSKRGLDSQRFYKKDLSTGVKTNIELPRTKQLDGNGNIGSETIYPIRNRHNNLYDFGLSEMISNPFKEQKSVDVIKQYRLDAKLWKPLLDELINEDYITKQTWAEIRFSLSPEELTERPSPRATKDNPYPQTKLMNHKVVLYDEPNPFCEDNLNGFLSIQLLKNDRGHRVAPNPEVINTALHGWVLVEQAKEHRQSMDLRQLKNKAIGRLASLFEDYPVTSQLEENIPFFIASIITDSKKAPLITGKPTPVKVSEKLDDFLSSNSSLEFNIKEFNKAVDLFEKTPDLFYSRYVAQQMRNTKMIQNVNAQWHYRRNNGENMNWESFEQLITYIYSEMAKPDSTILNEILLVLKQRYTAIVPNHFKVVEEIQ